MQNNSFPFELPASKPDRPLSAAMERLYEAYHAPSPETNPLYSTFKFTPLEGLDYNDGDGTISRRDPSKIIRVNGKYYVWYTKRHTPAPPRGVATATDTIPSADWDLAEIWYATSDDGFVWAEAGVAVTRPTRTAGRLAFGQHAGYFGLEGQILSVLSGLFADVGRARR